MFYYWFSINHKSCFIHWSLRTVGLAHKGLQWNFYRYSPEVEHENIIVGYKTLNIFTPALVPDVGTLKVGFRGYNPMIASYCLCQ